MGEARTFGGCDRRLDHRGPRPAIGTGPQRGRVRLHHATHAFALDDGHHDRARLRAGELGDHRHAQIDGQAEGHLDYELVVRLRDVDALRRRETKSRVTEYGWNPGSRRLATTSTGSQVPSRP